MSDIWFDKVDGPYGWLGNMAPYPVLHLGRRWLTTEALFQALRFGDEDLRMLICAEKSPMGAKMMAKKHAEAMVVAPMSDQDLEHMRLCVRLKLEQHKQLQGRLLATGEAVIREDVTKRNGARHEFWGTRRLPDGGIRGHNWLGTIWMERRDVLRSSGMSIRVL